MLTHPTPSSGKLALKAAWLGRLKSILLKETRFVLIAHFLSWPYNVTEEAVDLVQSNQQLLAM